MGCDRCGEMATKNIAPPVRAQFSRVSAFALQKSELLCLTKLKVRALILLVINYKLRRFFFLFRDLMKNMNIMLEMLNCELL